MKKFTKTALTIPEQITQLKSRGLIISNDATVSHYLSNISYYRLSAYFHTFLQEPKEEHKFLPNTTFEKILDLYVFDRKLRVLLFDEIERIEVAFRTQLILQYSLAYGNNWYENPDLFYNQNFYIESQGIIQNAINNSDETFIKHYKAEYGIPPNPPAWMTIEIISFPQLSKIYKNLKSCEAKNKIAEHFGVNTEILISWLESLSLVRNTVAHHARLWNRAVTKVIKIPKVLHKDGWAQHKFVVISRNPDTKEKIVDNSQATRLYAIVCIIQYLMKAINPETHFGRNLRELLIKEHYNIPKKPMGIPPDWEKDPFWKVNK